MTLVELSVVIFFLLLLAVLFLIGARAWKRGSDRAMCIVNIQAVQKAVRGYANFSGRDPGVTVSGLENEIIGPGRFFDSLPTCPGGGTYTLGGDVIPEVGTLYMECSLGVSEGHVPDDLSGW